jgi:hypothetical protein
LARIALASFAAAFSIFSFTLVSFAFKGMSESDDSPICSALALGRFLAFRGTSLSSESESSLTTFACWEVRRRLL